MIGLNTKLSDNTKEELIKFFEKHKYNFNFNEKKYILNCFCYGRELMFSENDILRLMDAAQINDTAERYRMIKDYIGYLDDNELTKNKKDNNDVNEIDVVRFFNRQNIDKGHDSIVKGFIGLFKDKKINEKFADYIYDVFQYDTSSEVKQLIIERIHWNIKENIKNSIDKNNNRVI